MNSNTHRRDFLKGAIVAAGFPTIIPASALGKNGHVAPSNRVTIGVIGCGGRSNSTRAYEAYDKVEVVAVCDAIREKRNDKLKMHRSAKAYADFRDLLARSDVDGVHVVTGDYWHVPLSLYAARAGKDVYCEKPLGLTIEQDLAAREIVEKHNRIFQYGAQQRSMTHMRLGVELVLNGHIGDVKEVYAWAPHGESGGSATPVLPVPDGFDYNMWLGPAPEAPFCHDRCLLRKERKAIFHIYDYAIGFIAGWGAHPVDILQWWADAAGMGIPAQYHGKGTLPTEGLFNTLTHWDVEGVYADGTKLYFMDDRTARKSRRMPDFEKVKKFENCTMFVGTKGWVAVSRQGWAVSSEEIRRKAKDAGPTKLPVSREHMHNFVDAILSRQQPVGTLDSAVRSDIICQLGDICIRTGETIGWDPKEETVVGSDKAVAMMHRDMRKPWTL